MMFHNDGAIIIYIRDHPQLEIQYYQRICLIDFFNTIGRQPSPAWRCETLEKHDNDTPNLAYVPPGVVYAARLSGAVSQPRLLPPGPVTAAPLSLNISANVLTNDAAIGIGSTALAIAVAIANTPHDSVSTSSVRRAAVHTSTSIPPNRPARRPGRPPCVIKRNSRARCLPTAATSPRGRRGKGPGVPFGDAVVERRDGANVRGVKLGREPKSAERHFRLESGKSGNCLAAGDSRPPARRHGSRWRISSRL
jgi:hypothetical protein